MRAGRDLLATHFSTGPDGARRGRSEWAPAVSSGPVTRALLSQVGSWARQIASQGAVLALFPGRTQRGTVHTRRGLNSACQWLAVLDCAVQAAERQDPVPAEDARLLQAIPVNAVPPRRVPDGTERVPALCEGTVGSAERIRQVIWLLAPQASWSPGLTADSLRHSAGCGIVISHHAEILLRSLASRAAWHGDAAAQRRADRLRRGRRERPPGLAARRPHLERDHLRHPPDHLTGRGGVSGSGAVDRAAGLRRPRVDPGTRPVPGDPSAR